MNRSLVGDLNIRALVDGQRAAVHYALTDAIARLEARNDAPMASVVNLLRRAVSTGQTVFIEDVVAGMLANFTTGHFGDDVATLVAWAISEVTPELIPAEPLRTPRAWLN